MAYEEIQSTLFARLQSGWTANGTTLRTPVAVTNSQALLTRVDGTLPIAAPTPNTAWIRFSLTGMAETRRDLGRTARVEVRGHVALQVFTPIGTGTVLSDQLIDLLRALYERKEFVLTETGCRMFCGVAGPSPGGTETGRWWQRNVWIPFTATEHRAIPA